MNAPLILASSSKIRAQLLNQAAVSFEVKAARVDEQSIKEALIAEGAPPRGMADALAESKARKVAGSHPDRLVLGCDQVLAVGTDILSKPKSKSEALEHLRMLCGKHHQLLSAAVIYEDAKPVWRHIGVVRLFMREASDAWLQEYVSRNWESIQYSVGGYKLEEEGVRLFTRIDGDHFNVLGLPLLELLSYLTLRGTLES